MIKYADDTYLVITAWKTATMIVASKRPAIVRRGRGVVAGQ